MLRGERTGGLARRRLRAERGGGGGGGGVEGESRGLGAETRGGKGETEGEAEAVGAAAGPSRRLLLWVTCKCFGVRAVPGGHGKRHPHHPAFPVEKKGVLKMMRESPEGGGRINTSSPPPPFF